MVGRWRMGWGRSTPCMSVSLHSGTADFLHVTLVSQSVPSEAGEERELGGGGGPGNTQVTLQSQPRRSLFFLQGAEAV